MSSQAAAPAFRRIVTDLKQMIEEGKLKEHDALPSERTVADQYDVSRMTARRALEAMEAEGIAYAKDRLGRFVSPKRLNYNVNSMADFVLDAAQEGIHVDTRLIDSRMVHVDAGLARQLEVTPDTALCQTTRLFLRDDHAMFLEEETVVSERAIRLLRQAGIKEPCNPSDHRVSPFGHSADIVIRMCALTAGQAEHLRMLPFQAGIEQEQLTRDARMFPICLTRQVWRGELAQFLARAILQPQT